MRFRVRMIVAACIAVLSVAVGSCGHSGGHSGYMSGASRVSVIGGKIRLDGEPWWPTGFDAYQLGTDWSVNQGCGAQVDVDRYFKSLPAHSLTRFNAYASLARNKYSGAEDFTPIDAIFAAAERHGQFLIPVLSSGEGACEDGVFKDHDWYAGGWRAVSLASTFMPYARWLDTAVVRWGQSSALAGWELVGEPEPSLCGDSGCSWQVRRCPSDAAATLRGFFDSAGARLRALDADAPIWEGVAGGSQCGVRGDEYSQVSRSPFIDVLELHDYGPPGVPLPGNTVDGVLRRLEQARQVGKPLVVAEMGQPAGSCRTLRERADDLAGKVRTQRQAGAAGVMFWAFVPDPRLGDCTFDIGFDDPLFGVLAALSH
jgi:mannan endo-1,4-beta-mannosidase